MTSCCPSTRVPALTPQKDYTPIGESLKLPGGRDGKDVRCYRVGQGTTAVVLIHDIFGIDSGRHIGLCDTIARELGCVVVAPCLYRGDSCTFADLGTPRLFEQVKRHPPVEMAKDLDVVYKSLGAEIKAIGLIGFCFGSWMVYKESARMGDPRIKAGANFHPSLGLDGQFGGSVGACVEAAKALPQLVCPCSDDDVEMVKTMLTNMKTIKLHSFETMNHGFMSQGDTEKDAEVKKQVNVGVNLACEWFRSQL